MGGAQGVAAWIVHALQPDHEVTLIGWEAPHLEAVNRRYGTALDPRRLRIEVARSRLLRHIPARVLRLDDLRSWSLQRVARRKAPHYDLVIGAGNEADLGDRAIQYVHDPSLVFRRRGGMDRGWYHATTLLEVAYFELGARLTGFAYSRMRRNLTLVPSRWVGEWVQRVHAIDPVVLHPPAAGTFPDVPWRERVDGFVWCGRLWPDRNVERAIDIVERVRRHGGPATLTLIGATGGSRNVEHIRYGERIRALVRDRAAWVTLHLDVDRTDLCRIMASHRYGLGTVEEGFGMAVAELVRAGAITFLPRGGGQAEVVGDDERLLFSTEEEAVRKGVATMRDPALQDSLRATLLPIRDRFSSGSFVRELRRLVGAAPASHP
jgi:glycosyltransferase involved in cell wall biosynthesis